MNVSDVVSLTIDGAETDRPLGWVSSGKLRDVGSGLALHVGGALVVNALDVVGELVKLRYDKLTPERLGDEDSALLQQSEGCLVIIEFSD